MNKLFIIGNGFDCYGHNMKTKYSDFRQFILSKFPHIERIPARIPRIPVTHVNKNLVQCEIVRYILHVLDICQDANWSTFESSLGEAIFYTIIDDILDNGHSLEISKSFSDGMEDMLNCMDELNELVSMGLKIEDAFVLLKKLFYQWITESLSNIKYENYCRNTSFDTVLDCVRGKTSNVYINFNYTHTLEKLYDIPPEQVCHIHGKIGDPIDNIIFGHGVPFNNDVLNECPEMSSFFQYISRILRKKTFRVIESNKVLFENTKNVSEIYSFGFSFSNVDMVYIDEICKYIVPQKATWYFNSYDTKYNQHLIKMIQEYGFIVKNETKW